MSQDLGDLENVYFEENAYLETLYNHEQAEVDMHFKSILDKRKRGAVEIAQTREDQNAFSLRQ